MADWHNIFGLTLMDFFLDSPYKVELEREISMKQRLDIIIIRKEEGKEFSEELPDGFENLSNHNLVTYKSLHESLDSWILHELVGHYVNYRKIISKNDIKLLPDKDFKLIAITTRMPKKLAAEADLNMVKPGVYELKWGSQTISIIALNLIKKTQANAIWQLFSGLKIVLSLA